MFCGIVETMGIITHLIKCDDGIDMTIKPNQKFDDLSVGDSISVNGVCLTITKKTFNNFAVTLVPETVRLTHFAAAQQGDKVNLERSLAVNGRIGGHYVQGHCKHKKMVS